MQIPSRTGFYLCVWVLQMWACQLFYLADLENISSTWKVCLFSYISSSKSLLTTGLIINVVMGPDSCFMQMECYSSVQCYENKVLKVELQDILNVMFYSYMFDSLLVVSHQTPSFSNILFTSQVTQLLNRQNAMQYPVSLWYLKLLDTSLLLNCFFTWFYVTYFSSSFIYTLPIIRKGLCQPEIQCFR